MRFNAYATATPINSKAAAARGVRQKLEKPMSDYKFPIFSLSLALTAFVVGAYLGFQQEAIWFARFGSVIVLFGVISEYALLQMELATLYQALRGQGAAECGNSGIPDLSPKVKHVRLARLSHVVIVIGTFVWGFGDWYILWVQNSA